jgi:hypothetical protein
MENRVRESLRDMCLCSDPVGTYPTAPTFSLFSHQNTHSHIRYAYRAEKGAGSAKRRSRARADREQHRHITERKHVYASAQKGWRAPICGGVTPHKGHDEFACGWHAR